MADKCQAYFAQAHSHRHFIIAKNNVCSTDVTPLIPPLITTSVRNIKLIKLFRSFLALLCRATAATWSVIIALTNAVLSDCAALTIVIAYMQSETWPIHSASVDHKQRTLVDRAETRSPHRNNFRGGRRATGIALLVHWCVTRQNDFIQDVVTNS